MPVDFARAAERWSLLLRSEESAARVSYEIAVEPQAYGLRLVHLDGRTVPVKLLTPGTRGGSTGGTVLPAGPVAIAAPMPGRVVKVLVAPGDAVAARQGLVVVEAMKMENELRAPRAGTIAEVRVQEGAPVDANAVLVVIT
jgi:biotin carboxyl carrier protein